MQRLASMTPGATIAPVGHDGQACGATAAAAPRRFVEWKGDRQRDAGEQDV